MTTTGAVERLRHAAETAGETFVEVRRADLRSLLAALQPAEVRPDEPAPTPDEVIELLRDPAQTTVEHRVLNNLSVLVALDIAGPEARREIARRMASPPLPPPLPAPVEVRGVVAAVQTAHIPDEITIRCDAPLPGGARWWAGRVVRIVPGGGR